MAFNIDLHSHSFFSGDGVSSPEDLIAAARAKGLHGLAITDHNTCDAVNYLLEKGLMRLDGQPVDSFLVLPGVEVTTADGHLLCIGAELPYLKGKPAREVCDMIHERGGLAIPQIVWMWRNGQTAAFMNHIADFARRFSFQVGQLRTDTEKMTIGGRDLDSG